MDKNAYFVGVGAQRAGTSWLYKCLIAHPDVFMPQKEVHFFDENYDRGVDWYKGLFNEIDGQAVYGELTPDYMSSPDYLDKIKAFNPNAKILISLRNPVERCYSAYCLYKTHGRYGEKRFEHALKHDPQIFEKSLYSKQLKWIRDRFECSQINISLYDDLEADPLSYIQNVYQFLSIDDSFVPLNLKERSNIGVLTSTQGFIDLPKLQRHIQKSRFGRQFQKFKSSVLGRNIKQLLVKQKKNSAAKVTLPPEYHKILLKDIDDLSQMIDRNLDKWKHSI